MSDEFRQSILIVETDPSQCADAKKVLQSAGFQVTCASTFDEAKRLIAKAPPHVLITELRLGAYNGLHLVLRTRIDHPEVSAIVTSEFADRVLEAEAERQSAAFLLRPLDGEQLLTAVARSLKSSATSASLDPAT